jgi:mRNA-degrading endonuclease toxin of MazEF toxin-antitoxin module
VTLDCGDTFLIEDEDGYDSHLWIVLTPPSEGEVVIVSVTTHRKKSENLVRLKKGDHPFIAHDSVIAYSHSKVVTVESIESAMKNGVAKHRERVSDELLQRARAGLLESDFTPNAVRHLYNIFMGT